MMGGGRFFPNTKILAGDDGGEARDILARDDIISGDDQGRDDKRVASEDRTDGIERSCRRLCPCKRWLIETSAGGFPFLIPND